MFQRPSQSQYPNGAVIRDNRNINRKSNQPSASNVAYIDEVVDPEVTIYKSHQRSDLGPIGRLHPATTLYDLFLSNAPDIIEVRSMFHDWTFPDIKVFPATDTSPLEKRIIPVRNFGRGRVGSTEFRVDQYVYAVINPHLTPIQGFGTTDLMKVDKTSVLVCVNACDARYGNLQNAYVEYAVRMSAPVVESVTLAGCEIVEGKPVHYATLNGDLTLEEAVSNDWFNTTTYKFNSAIYPLIRSYSHFELDVQPISDSEK